MDSIKSARPGLMFLFLGWLSLFSSAAAQASNGAVILLYHHVASDTPASTSISPEQFARHMEFISTRYDVQALPDVIEAIRQGQEVSDRTLVITFDDGYVDILENAHPVLSKHGFPYTIFINPAVIGERRDQLNWQQITEMQQQGVTFANHTLDHLHMLERQPGENEADWLERVSANVSEAQALLEQKTGQSLKYLAYPYGEFNRTLADHLQNKGYVGFGQHSGGISKYSDFSALPRFPAAGPYARLETLKTKMASLAMPVTASSIEDPHRQDPGAPGQVSFTVALEDVDLGRANCFYRGDTLPLSVDDKTLSYQLDKTLPVGRSRVNCTAPSLAQAGRYYWYSQPFFVADEQGRFPE